MTVPTDLLSSSGTFDDKGLRDYLNRIDGIIEEQTKEIARLNKRVEQLEKPRTTSDA